MNIKQKYDILGGNIAPDKHAWILTFSLVHGIGAYDFIHKNLSPFHRMFSAW